MNFCPRCGIRMRMDPGSKEFVCPACTERMAFSYKTDEGLPLLDSYLSGDKEEPTGDGSRSSQQLRITQDDIFLLPTIRRMMEQEIPYFQKAFNYAEERYDEECQECADECPDYLDGLEPELYYKQVYFWFMCEKVLPSIGNMTVLEEFVEGYVVPKDPDVAQRMLLARNAIRGSFRALDTSHYPYILVEHLETGTKYLAVSKIDWPQARRLFVKGGVAIGKIHPWWRDRYYMFDGIISRKQSGEESARELGLITPTMMEEIKERLEDDQVERYEEILVNSNTTLQSAMNKYPSHWVDTMCSAVGIDVKVVRTKSNKARAVVSKLESGYAEELLRSKKIGERHIAALKMLLENDWVVRYGQLTKRFSSETGFWWNERPPKSELGVLRLHGLLVVGRMPEGGRLYKAAVVPLELRAAIKRFLPSPSFSKPVP